MRIIIVFICGLLTFTALANMNMFAGAMSTSCPKLTADWTPQWANLIGYWPLGGIPGQTYSTGTSIPASIGSAGTLTHTNTASPSGYIQGNPESALLMNGTTDYGIIPFSASYQFGKSNDFSVMVWFLYPTSQNHTGNTDNSLIEPWAGGGYPFVLRIYNQMAGANIGKIRLARNYTTGENPAVASTNTFNNNKWHHVVATKSGLTLSLYVDGNLEGTVSDSSTATGTTVNASGIGIGVRPFATKQNFFTGAISNLAIWNTALSAAEIKKIYYQQKCN